MLHLQFKIVKTKVEINFTVEKKLTKYDEIKDVIYSSVYSIFSLPYRNTLIFQKISSKFHGKLY